MSLDGSAASGSTASTAACRPARALAELIAELGLDPLRVAVERNLEIVPRSTLRRDRSRTATIMRSSISSEGAE
jgi:sulfur carrier protein ThiS